MAYSKPRLAQSLQTRLTVSTANLPDSKSGFLGMPEASIFEFYQLSHMKTFGISVQVQHQLVMPNPPLPEAEVLFHAKNNTPPTGSNV